MVSKSDQPRLLRPDPVQVPLRENQLIAEVVFQLRFRLDLVQYRMGERPERLLLFRPKHDRHRFE